ncbi:MAG: hypothetical protein ABW007_18790 [Chitinophagaceae bacterium]
MPSYQDDALQPRYEWAFIFVIYANHDAEDEAVPNPSPGGGQVNATARWVGHLYNDLNKLKIDQKHKILILHNRIINEMDITYLQELSTPAGRIRPIDEIREQYLLQKPKELGNRLKQLLRGVQAKKHCVVFCDHGSIFGINKVHLPDGSFLPTPAKNPLFRNYSFYDDKDSVAKLVLENKEKMERSSVSFEVLTNEELVAALKAGIGKKVDLLMMYNCNMANLMTLFSLQGYVEILLGAASTMNYPGYNFKYVLSNLSSNQGLHLHEDCQQTSAIELTRLFLTSFVDNNPKYESQAEEIESWTIAAFYPDDLTQQFLFRFNALCQVMIKHIDAFYGEIEEVLYYAYPLDGNAKENNRILFDFRTFALGLYKRLSKNPVYDKLHDLKSQLRSFGDDQNLPRYSLFLGKTAFKIGRYQYNIALQHPTGLGIFLPRDETDIEEQIDSFFKNEGNPLPAFFLNTRWLEFCQAYCDKI